ncbi:MAG: hypothetical protein CUN52_01050 [Phototrophicales bacterium]|nr:MAG: hypothetical protein CUN52_01050 [Phototrophicales bacterium]
MAYGRLDVFYPSGDFATYLLDGSSVSVGRSAGCTIVLDTDTISRYHFSITYDGREVKISDMDSANGTFVDGVQLAANESRVLLGGEELQIGHLRMIYYALNEDPTTFVDVAPEETQRYDRPDVGFSMEVYGSEIAVPPGSYTTIEINLTNMTAEAHNYIIEATGLPEGWGKFNRPSIALEPDETGQIIYSVKPLRQSTSTPGDYPITFTITQQDNPEKKLEGGVSVRILPYSGFGVALANPHLQDDESFRLFLLNQGSIALPLTISGYSADDALQFHIQQTQVSLAPGQRMEVRGTIKPKQRRLFGQPRQHDFDLRVKSRDIAAFLTAVPAHYTEKAILPAWAAYAVAGVGAIFTLLLVGLLIILAQPASSEPQILRLDAEKSQAIAGQIVRLNWQAKDAISYDVRVNNVPIQTNISAQTTQWDFDTFGYQGMVQVELVAHNGDKSTSQVQEILVHPKLVVNHYTITPNVLIRNVIQTVTLRWDVSGAQSVTISNIPTMPQQAPVQSAGLATNSELSVSILPDVQSDTLFLLSVQDALGNSYSERPDYTIADAECFTVDTLIQTRAFPRPDSQVIQTYEASNSRIVVDGRDANTEWLRVPLTGGASAWVKAIHVQCGFNPADLRLVSLPVVTAEPTITPITSVPTSVPNTSVPTVIATTPVPTFTPITPTLAPTKTLPPSTNTPIALSPSGTRTP